MITSFVSGGGGNEIDVANKPLTTLTSSATLTRENHSGHIILVNHASNVATIDLPAVADARGMHFTLLMSAALSSDCVIDAQANDDIRCFQFNVTDTAANIGVWTEGRYLTYDESTGAGGDGNIGDRIDVICDGAYYHVIAFGRDAATWAAAD